MAWNRPNIEIKPKPKKHNRTSLVISLALLTAAVTVVCVCMTTGHGSLPGESSGDRKRISNKGKIATRKNVATRKVWRPSKEPDKTAKLSPPTRVTKDLVELGGLPSNCLIKASIFRHQSDGMIAGILTAVPGDHFLTDDFDEDFEEAFKASLKDPIEIKPDDSDEDCAVKQAVIHTREMLKAAMDKGDSVADIMHCAQEELEKITAYRDQLADAMQDLLDRAEYDEAIGFCEEANELLKEYNAIPLHLDEHDLAMARQNNGEADQE